MKNPFLLQTTLIVLLTSCSQFEKQDVVKIDNPYSISIAEINRIELSGFATFPKTKTNATILKEITPIIEGVDTLLYVINYGKDEGWVIASADKRLPMVLAMSEFGSFDLVSAAHNTGLMIWFNDLKKQINYLKKNPGFVPDPNVAIQSNSLPIQTKGGGEGDHEGEWLQLVYTMIMPQTRYYVDHLMETHWGQGYPWNTCVPFDGNGHRCQTGTGVTALAQLSYYWRKPLTAYAYGTCTNDYYQPSDLQLFSPSASVWNTMALDSISGSSTGYQAVAALMANIGSSTNTVYTPTVTLTDYTACSGYLTNSGIYMYGNTFDNDRVLANILYEEPVLLLLSDGNNATQYAVIDGIQVISECTAYYYQWMPIGTYPPVEPEYPDLDHPELYEIYVNWGNNIAYFHRINWGFDGLYDNAWYWHGNTYPYWDGLNTPIYAFY